MLNQGIKGTGRVGIGDWEAPVMRGGWGRLCVAIPSGALLRAVQIRESRTRKRGSDIDRDKGSRLDGSDMAIRPWDLRM